MKFIVFVVLVLVSLDGLGQQRLCAGASLGANLSGTTRYRYMTDKPTVYQVGWNVNALFSYDLSERFRTMAQIGGVIERHAIESAYYFNSASSQYSRSFNWTYSWAEGMAMINYIPIVREKYEILAGTGLTIRRIIRAGVDGQVTKGYNSSIVKLYVSDDMTDKMYNWNYWIPLTLGTTIKVGSGKLLFMAEYQIGLRDWVKPVMQDPPVPNGYDWSADKLYAMNLKVGYMMPIGK